MGQHGDAEPQGVYLHTARSVALTELTEFTQAVEENDARRISPQSRFSNSVTKLSSFQQVHQALSFICFTVFQLDLSVFSNTAKCT